MTLYIHWYFSGIVFNKLSTSSVIYILFTLFTDVKETTFSEFIGTLTEYFSYQEQLEVTTQWSLLLDEVSC